MTIEKINAIAKECLLETIDIDKIQDKYINLSGLKTYTIDEEKTNEIDDAISLQITKGKKIIWIHIANPSSFIKFNSDIDIEARRKGASIYLPGMVDLMLPSFITDNLLSLKSGRYSPALSAGIEIGNNGDIINYKITRSIIKTDYNLTYTDADDLIELIPPEEEDLSILSEIIMRRYQWRLSNGAVMLEQPEGRLSYHNNELTLKIIEPTPSRTLIKESMLLMGFVISDFARKNLIPIPFRIQPKSSVYNKQITNTHIPHVKNSAIKQKLFKATLTSKPGEHFSLGLN